MLSPNPEFAEWLDRADHYAKPDTVERAYADFGLALIEYARGHFEESFTLMSKSLDLARRLQVPELLWHAGMAYLIRVASPHRMEQGLELAEEMLKLPRNTIGIERLAPGLWQISFIFLAMGRRERAEEIWYEMRSLAERTEQAQISAYSMFADHLTAILDGHLEDTENAMQAFLTRATELGVLEVAAEISFSIFINPLLYIGKATSLLQERVQRTENTTSIIDSCRRILSLVHLGRFDEAEEGIEQLISARPKITSAEDETLYYHDLLLLESAILIKHNNAADLILRRFTGSSISTTYQFGTCVSRYLGAAAAMLKRPDEARSHYRDALKVATDMRIRPEIALTRFKLAELLSEYYHEDQAEATEHLDFAINEFREMKMQPYIEKTQALKDNL